MSEFREYEQYKDISDVVADRIRFARKKKYPKKKVFAMRLYNIVDSEKEGVIKKACEEKPEAISKAYSKIKDRDNYRTPYNIDELCKVCNLLDVDIDYLLFRQDEETRDIKDLRELTGLSENACKILASYSKAIKPENDDTDGNAEAQRIQQIELLSWLIENGLMRWMIAFNNVIESWWKDYSFDPFDSDSGQKEIDKDELKTATIQDDVRLTRADVYYTDRELSDLIHAGFVAIGKERYKDAKKKR